jgi:N-carbamoyl-L-amino-acid hydrolase
MRVNGKRLWASLMEMAEIGPTAKGGCNRQALTSEDRRARDLFCEWARSLGCVVQIDQIGNIFARRNGTNFSLDPVLVGSHLDTQATGGKFDGVYGVLSGIEVLRTLHEANIITLRPIEIAVWTNEEGCRFAPAMLGSGVMAGAYDLEFAYSRSDASGVLLGHALMEAGYRGELRAEPRPYHAMFEAHIEQGPILEKTGTMIGVVTGIQGAYWLDITLSGTSAHAGPTPMELRRDPWYAATKLIDAFFDLARAHGPWGRATIGNVRTSPGARNTVPETVTISLDIRHPEASNLDSMKEAVYELVTTSCNQYALGADVQIVWHMPPTNFDERLVNIVEQQAKASGYSYTRIVSGAGHDSLHTASFAPTCMIFIPCEGGLSHNEAETITAEQAEAGCNILLNSVLVIANEASHS